MRVPGPLNSIAASGPASLITGTSFAWAETKPFENTAKSAIAMIRVLIFMPTLQSQLLMRKLS